MGQDNILRYHPNLPFGTLTVYCHIPIAVTVDIRLAYCYFSSPSWVHSDKVHCRNHTVCGSL